MKISPCLSRGIVFLHEDGKTFEIAPLQVFAGPGGGTIIRIGLNTLRFAPDGSYEVNECRVDLRKWSLLEVDSLRDALSEQQHNRNCRPDEPYFEPGTALHSLETSAWPRKNLS